MSLQQNSVATLSQTTEVDGDIIYTLFKDSTVAAKLKE